MTSVNIPRQTIDPNYRYTMPRMRIKSEGRGNGTKTRLENITEIAKALERPPIYIMKYFSFGLGTLIKDDLINGDHSGADLAEILDSFIDGYVLCGTCGNPETEIKVGWDNVGLLCRACGSITQCDPTQKLTTFIMRNPPQWG